MSNQIPVAHVEMYRSNVIMLAQQKGSRLLGTVRNDGSVVGRTVYYERIGPTSAQQITTRHADTPLANTPHSRRRAEMTDWDWADLIDNIDRIRTIYQPDNHYAVSGGWAVGRSIDDVIIAAANGNAYEGQSGATVTALPAGQKVAVAATGLTIAKLLSARELLDAADVDPDLPRHIIVTAKQVTDLLNTTEVKSSDFNTVKALAQGAIDTFMGFKFIRTQRLTLDGSGNRLVLAYTQAALGVGMGQDLMVDIGPRRDKRNATQVYVCASLAATRIEDEQLVQIACTP
jgi:hypothetical protein